MFLIASKSNLKISTIQDMERENVLKMIKTKVSLTPSLETRIHVIRTSLEAEYVKLLKVSKK